MILFSPIILIPAITKSLLLVENKADPERGSAIYGVSAGFTLFCRISVLGIIFRNALTLHSHALTLFLHVRTFNFRPATPFYSRWNFNTTSYLQTIGRLGYLMIFYIRTLSVMFTKSHVTRN